MRIKITLIHFLLLIGCLRVHAQDTIRVLHYTETTGYDHGTRNQSGNMFQRICDTLNATTNFVWILTNSDSSEVFDNLNFINNYQVVVWANTSGASGLTTLQQQNYEQYVINGGNYLGIHAASDTYRHSSSNGNNTGIWDFYAENLSGCSVQENPNHTAANHPGIIQHLSTHPIQNGLPNPWNKNEEYYYWENGFLESTFNSLLEVGATGMNSYDSSRMVAQYKEHSWGSKSFYTSLGHEVNDYINDGYFELLLKNALLWLGQPSTPSNLFSNPLEDDIVLSPNPVLSKLHFINSPDEGLNVILFDCLGNQQASYQSIKELDFSPLSSGFYFILFEHEHRFFTKKVIKL